MGKYWGRRELTDSDGIAVLGKDLLDSKVTDDDVLLFPDESMKGLDSDKL